MLKARFFSHVTFQEIFVRLSHELPLPPPKKNHLKHLLNIIYSGLIYMYEYSTQNFIHTFVRYIDTRLKHVTRQREVSKRGAWSDIRDKKKGIIITTDLE